LLDLFYRACRCCWFDQLPSNLWLIDHLTTRHTPHHGTKEVVFVAASLTTRDPGDIRVSVQNAVTQGLQCHVISLASDVYLYRNLAKLTGGMSG
jgi:hypothetical protein